MQDNQRDQNAAHRKLAEGTAEIERLRGLFKKVQAHCGGDAHPRWGRDPATTNSRGYLLDLCNSALD